MDMETLLDAMDADVERVASIHAFTVHVFYEGPTLTHSVRLYVVNRCTIECYMCICV